MRKLTIKREKSFIGSLGIMKVYIEDQTSDELTMTVETENGPVKVSCRKLGEIKNGEEVSFDIGEDAARIFVIADKLSKDYCNECYQLPMGSEDIYLTGRNRFNPAAGNAFRFDGNENAITLKSRKKGTKRGLVILILSMLIGFTLGYGITSAILGIINNREKSFESGGMTITLNKSFTEEDASGYDSLFVSKNVELVTMKTTFKSFGTSHLTAAEFASTVIMNNKDIEDCEISESDGVAYYTFDAVAKDDRTYTYCVYTYKTDSAYWQLYFITRENKYNRYADDIERWAGSVKFE